MSAKASYEWNTTDSTGRSWHLQVWGKWYGVKYCLRSSAGGSREGTVTTNGRWYDVYNRLIRSPIEVAIADWIARCLQEIPQ
jgi:hypothetical protein